MCTFIISIISESPDIEKIKKSAKDFDLTCYTFENRSITDHIGEKNVQFITTKECNCATELGLGSEEFENIGKNPEEERKKIERKGWSRAKINRWMEEREKIRERDKRNKPLPGSELKKWVSFISSILTQGFSSFYGIIIHDFDGGIATENIPLAGKLEASLKELTPEYLLELKRDVFYQFSR